MTRYMKGTKYAVSLHRIISKALKEYGIAEKLPAKEKNEKISKFNAYLRSKFQNLGIKKHYALSLAIKIIGDENDFDIQVYRIFILKPYGVIEGEEFKLVNDEEFEQLYDDTVNEVLGQEKLKTKDKKDKSNDEPENEKLSLLDFLK